MTDNTLVKYVHNFQSKEQAIQHFLENARIKMGDAEVSLEDALLDLCKSYGTSTKQAIAQTQVAANLHTMIQHYKSIAFRTLEERQEMINRAAGLEKDAKEKEWEAEVLAEARKKREEQLAKDQ